MSKILNIEELKEMAKPIINIPNFDNTGAIQVRVQRPRLIEMASQGKIPNHLLNIAATMIAGGRPKGTDKMKDEDKIKMIDDTMKLYCMACLVEPTYEEFKDIMTDDQKGYIFSWGIGEVSGLDSFRKFAADGTHDNDSKEVSQET